MRIINVYEAKTQLSKLLNQVASGEEIVISRAGRPVAQLIPYQLKHKPRVPGAWKNKVKINPDFDELPEDFLSAFGVSK